MSSLKDILGGTSDSSLICVDLMCLEAPLGYQLLSPSPYKMSAVGYMYQGEFQPLLPGEEAYFYFHGNYYPVTQHNIRQGNEHPKATLCIRRGEENRALEGAEFLLEAPKPTILGYYVGTRLVELRPGEELWLIHGDSRHPLRWKCDLEYLKYPECQPYSQYQDQWTMVPSRNFYTGGELPSLPVPPELPSPQVAPRPVVVQIPPAAVPASQPRGPVVVQLPPAAVPLNPPTAPKNFSKPCKACLRMSASFKNILSRDICQDCLCDSITSQRLSVMINNSELVYTAEMIYQIMNFLRVVLPNQGINILPGAFPIPRDHVICIGKNEQVAPGYPPQGHIIGLPAVLEEGGCPNGHLLCKNHGDALDNCPVCGAFIPYKAPAPCPGHEIRP